MLMPLKKFSFGLNATSEGSFGEFHLGVPAASRVGIFKIISAEPKDANPPPFVPAEAVKFQRWRLDIQKAWANFESMLTEILPQAGGGFSLLFDNVGKDKDPNFDFKRELVGNLGDDLITFQKNPRTNNLASLSSPPSLLLIGSPNAEKLADAIHTVTSSTLLGPMLGQSGGKERDVRIVENRLRYAGKGARHDAVRGQAQRQRRQGPEGLGRFLAAAAL